MSWSEVLTRISGKLGFRPGVTEEALLHAEESMGERLPEDLRALYLESDGVAWKAEHLDLIWPLQELVKQNCEFRSNEDFRELYMSFAQLLFFADDGCGDQFGYRMLPEPSSGQVYRWDHENDDRT